DTRIQSFVDSMMEGLPLTGKPSIPVSSLVLDKHGLARELALPVNDDSFENSVISAYRTANGVIYNPLNDRRTTRGVFHIADVGLPVPGDKIPVPPQVFGNLLEKALTPPDELMCLPWSSQWKQPIHTFVSLLLRPVVVPAIPGKSPEKSMEIRFFVPGGLVASLDFVESVFGNAGDPRLPRNDAALDVEHWVGHTGAVILAPHLLGLTKKEIGLPHSSDATEREKDFGMYWEDEAELYNDGQPYKISMRDERGTMVTIITDNYFGYCKKEVKTQISMSANLSGLAEEEHAGGALVFASYKLGDGFQPDKHITAEGHSFSEVQANLGDAIEVQPQGYAIDRRFGQIHYIPEDTLVDLHRQKVSWQKEGKEESLKLLPGRVYIYPSGYKVRLEKHAHAPSWHLTGTLPEGVMIHKPSTVSGGGKSEISKTLWNAILSGPIYVHDFERDMELVADILGRDYSGHYRSELADEVGDKSLRSILSSERSLGSVVKLLMPSDDYTSVYNDWLRSIPNYILAQVFIIKRFYRKDWGDDWRSHFSVDTVNGFPGHELKYHGRKVVGNYLRVGLGENDAWHTYKLRQDFSPTDKVQMEDDITASVVVPSEWLKDSIRADERHPSVKLVANCEWRLFQRPDEAIYPGYDEAAERDISGQAIFCSNYQPLTPDNIQSMVNDFFLMDAFSEPMQDHLREAHHNKTPYTVCSSKPRMMGDKPTRNPRYLQTRPDVEKPLDLYIAEMGVRLKRRLKMETPLVFPVDSVIAGRRNNPPEEGNRPLCVYGPLHYQELPELFMDYICSITGKSPSTTGAGSEGALTKGPFNALRATVDLNNALVSMILSGYDGYSTAAGYIGPRVRVDHDISLLIPEVWCRLSEEERDADWLISNGYMEKIEDFEHDGNPVLASRLGYRITSRFVRDFLGRVFDKPDAVFPREILRPETQGLDVYVDGVNNIAEAQKRVASGYFKDGSV
ncbi:hypothetical protein KAI87_04590, partial [Myxococcota bacterium]|nr:hypothetical protein [Myxococcota bacterium]